jgi:hypothetical protein
MGAGPTRRVSPLNEEFWSRSGREGCYRLCTGLITGASSTRAAKAGSQRRRRACAAARTSVQIASACRSPAQLLHGLAGLKKPTPCPRRFGLRRRASIEPAATIAPAARRSEKESARVRGDRRLSPRFQALVPETERRSAPSRRSPQTKRHRCAAPFRDGASRTRTGDLLGAIQARALRFPPKKGPICRSFARPSAAPLGADSCGCPWITLAFRHSSRLVPEPTPTARSARPSHPRRATPAPPLAYPRRPQCCERRRVGR